MAQPNLWWPGPTSFFLYMKPIYWEKVRESSECNSALYSLLILVNLVNFFFFFVLCVDAGLWPNQFGQVNLFLSLLSWLFDLISYIDSVVNLQEVVLELLKLIFLEILQEGNRSRGKRIKKKVQKGFWINEKKIVSAGFSVVAIRESSEGRRWRTRYRKSLSCTAGHFFQVFPSIGCCLKKKRKREQGDREIAICRGLTFVLCPFPCTDNTVHCCLAPCCVSAALQVAVCYLLQPLLVSRFA